MSFQEIQVLFDTGLNKVPVGVLAAADQRLLFEYDASWITGGLELAPFYLPVAKRAFVFERSQLPSGLPGLCADSLPDGWEGRLPTLAASWPGSVDRPEEHGPRP